MPRNTSSKADQTVPPIFSPRSAPREFEELVEQYAVPRVDFDKAGPKILLVQLRNSWYRGMPADELHEKTCGWWLCSGRRREHAELAVGVAHGIIRCVYRVRTGSWRWTMDGERKRWVGLRAR
jgi:hypothetical protein